MTKTVTLINTPVLGGGIYTIPDIAALLNLSNTKVNRWISKFWDDKLGQEYKTKYSWNVEFTRAINFHTLIEIYTFYQLTEAGVRPAKILEAHKILSKKYHTPYPFAKKNIIKNIQTDGISVLFESNEGVYSLDKKLQLHLAFIRDFFKNLDFDEGNMAIRLWPLGRNRAIVCDPHHQFGQPVINGTNILADIISDMYAAGDSKEFIAKTYHISTKQVADAIVYGSKAA